MGSGHSLILGEHCPREAVAGGAVDQPQRLLVLVIRVDIDGQHGAEDLLRQKPQGQTPPGSEPQGLPVPLLRPLPLACPPASVRSSAPARRPGTARRAPSGESHTWFLPRRPHPNLAEDPRSLSGPRCQPNPHPRARLLAATGTGTARQYHGPLGHPCTAILGKSFDPSEPQFLICKMGMLTSSPLSQGPSCCHRPWKC